MWQIYLATTGKILMQLAWFWEKVRRNAERQYGEPFDGGSYEGIEVHRQYQVK